jgi:hypothetical protein
VEALQSTFVAKKMKNKIAVVKFEILIRDNFRLRGTKDKKWFCKSCISSAKIIPVGILRITFLPMI